MRLFLIYAYPQTHCNARPTAGNGARPGWQIESAAGIRDYDEIGALVAHLRRDYPLGHH